MTYLKFFLIAVPVVSFTESLYTGSESINPNITLTRNGDVFVAIDILIVIMNIPHADALRERLILHLSKSSKINNAVIVEFSVQYGFYFFQRDCSFQCWTKSGLNVTEREG